MKNKKICTSNPLKTRRIRSRDWAAVSSIYEQCFGPAYAGLRDNDGIVAVLDKVIVGFALFEVKPDEVYVANVGVDSTQRSCGTCGQMARKLIKLLPKLRRKKMTLIVARDNPHAIRCYRSAGFKPVKDETGLFSGSMMDMVYHVPSRRKGRKKARKASETGSS